MNEQFSNHLLRFIKSVDILEKHHCLHIIDMIKKYLEKVLDINYIRIMEVTDGVEKNSSPSLIELCGKKPLSLKKCKNTNKDIGQMPFSYCKEIKLWILPAVKNTTLNNTDKYIDKWSNTKSIPRYKISSTNLESKTSIIIPLMHDFHIRKKIGVVNFESNKYIEPTKIAMKTLEIIAIVISTVIRLHNIKDQFQKSTTESLQNLEVEMNNTTLRLTKPKIFLAYPDNANSDVKEYLRFIINEQYQNNIELYDWQKEYKSTRITEDLSKNIHQSKYGIFYLSEKNDMNNYKDNNNVLFEFGLFQRKNSFNDPNWILIREKKDNCDDIPFDLQDLKRIEVPRYDNDEIDEVMFRKKLLNALQATFDI